jgi:hypothetical protein
MFFIYQEYRMIFSDFRKNSPEIIKLFAKQKLRNAKELIKKALLDPK